MNAPEKKSNKTLIIVLVLGLGCLPAIAVIGILAAIAIPAFLRYIKQSKVAEAEQITKRIALGAEMHFAEHCEFPGSLPAHADYRMCCGGEKCLPGPGAAKFNELSVDLSQPTYFVYETERVDDTTYIVRGVADFVCGGPSHTVEVAVIGDKSTCSTETKPQPTRDVFQ